MKTSAVLGFFALTVLAASSASAAGGKETNVKSEKGGGETGATGTTAGTGAGSITSERDRDKVTGDEKTKVKPWEVGASWEAHTLLAQNDLEGLGPDKFYNFFYAYGRYEFFKYNRITLRAGFYQRFVADPGESGARLDDIYLAYTRTVPLPQKFRFAATASVIAPTSFISQKEGLITAPRLTLQLDKELGKYVLVTFRTFGEGDIQSHTSFDNGSTPNPIARMGASLSGEVTMPFHTPLSMGGAIFTGYTWYYDANATPPDLAGYPKGSTMVQADPSFTHNPTQQSYGGELYARYTMPSLAGIKSDVKVAIAEGDQSLLHDGVTHFYMFFRLSTQVYGALTLRY